MATIVYSFFLNRMPNGKIDSVRPKVFYVYAISCRLLVILSYFDNFAQDILKLNIFYLNFNGVGYCNNRTS